VKKKNALISVSDKTNLELLLGLLKDYNFNLISTGGTAKFIREHGFEVTEVADLTKFPEMLGGRVKTLHPNILGGILARRGNQEDSRELTEHKIDQIDLVIVNLYPFAEVINSENSVFADAVENIDIGGPTLLRSAAKNYQSVTVLSSPKQYLEFVDLVEDYGFDSEQMSAFREKLAIDVFDLVSDYDRTIKDFLVRKLQYSPVGISYKLKPEPDVAVTKMPKDFLLNLKIKQQLRYGENPHQNAAFYTNPQFEESGLAAAKQLQGKEISFNNLLDLDAAWSIVNEYDSSIPCAAIIKHNNPCGVAIAPSAVQAFSDALESDPVSAFGGIVALNVPVDLATATELSQIFLECIIAPDFSDEALDLLKTKANLRLLRCESKVLARPYDIKAVAGGYLIQENNSFLLDRDKLKVVTETKVAETFWVDILFAWKIVKHVKSNAIVVVKDGKTKGIGCGQTNRIKAVLDALAGCDADTRGAVLASDGFFPFPDSIDLAAQNHISVVIQPGGSVKDQEVIDACNQAGIAMVFTGTRHFRH